jgi:D-alanyl-lipoteichoic acid acyltransferase DltB (MBOAT superfamily)
VKYGGFVAQNLNALLQPAGLQVPVPASSLPLGISFFAFHAVSYLVDVYRGQFPANRSPLQVALYFLLFPQLVAGPIVRYKRIAPELRARSHRLLRASAGVRIFAIGLAQKVLIADQVAQIAEIVFDATPRPTAAEAWIGLLAYTLQIYFDFCGYSTMAVGLGLMIGFSLPRNFRRPYTARSVTEFWRRWHISLSSWFRDYLYIPLGGNRGPAWKTYRNLAIVFLLCGLWHGAAWTFVLWGAWHGAFLILERTAPGRMLDTLPGWLRQVYALLVVMGGWVLFRAGDLSAVRRVGAGLIGWHGAGGFGLALDQALGNIAIAALVLGTGIALSPWRPAVPRPWQPVTETASTFVLLVLALAFVAAGTYSPFLYFRF